MAKVEKYRKSYESDEEWECRKQFLKKHSKKFSVARLLCLAQVYVNITLLGCTYPKEVENEVNELAKDLTKKGLKRPPPSFCPVSFVKSEEEDQQQPSPSFCPVPFVKYQEDIPANKKMKNNPKNWRDQSSDSRGGLRAFVILEEGQTNASAILHRAAQFNNTKIELIYENLISEPLINCKVMLDDKLIGEAKGSTKPSAKENAMKCALEYLKPKVNVVKIKEAVYKGEVSHNNITNPSKSDEIGSDNRGFKLLQMMGWKGGGIGKGSSIPVGVKDVYKGQGLGFQPTDNIKACHIKTYLVEYMNSNSTADLIFSSEFSKEERKKIHAIASQLKLRSQSKGLEGVDRHLVISRKFTPADLLSLLKNSGGVTDKYELIPPSE